MVQLLLFSLLSCSLKLPFSTKATWVLCSRCLKLQPHNTMYRIRLPSLTWRHHLLILDLLGVNSLVSILWVSYPYACRWTFPNLIHLNIKTVVPSHEEASSLQDIARAVVSNQADRIYLRVHQCDIPTLILVRRCSWIFLNPIWKTPRSFSKLFAISARVDLLLIALAPKFICYWVERIFLVANVLKQFLIFLVMSIA